MWTQELAGVRTRKLALISLLSMCISLHMFHCQGAMRLPHDIHVEQGLPPNPGPGSRQEKSSGSMDDSCDKEAPEDNGSTPGLHHYGKCEHKESQREGEQGKGTKQPTLVEKEKYENTFCDIKRKFENLKICQTEIAFSKLRNG